MTTTFCEKHHLNLGSQRRSAMTLRNRCSRRMVLQVGVIAVFVLPTLANSCLGSPSAGNVCTRAFTASAARTACCTPSPTAVSLSTLSMIGGTAVMRIDEDWDLTVREPDSDIAAPQIGTVMTPRSSENVDLIFVLNHRFNPTYAPGGMEVQVWSNGQQAGSKWFGDALLHHADEKVTWTQRLMLKESDGSRYLCFRIVDGNSDTWGSFGGNEPLHLNRDTNLTDLSGYSSEFSVQNSGVTFASNRVATLVLNRVRGYSASGDLLFEESDPIVVYSSSESSQ